MIETAKKNIREKIVPLMEKKGVEDLGGDVYAVDGRAIKFEYNSDKQIFELSVCGLDADKRPDENWKVLVNWLFDSDSTEKDAISVANEFESVLEKELSIRSKKLGNAMPRKGEKGGVMNAEALAHKFLVLYPEYKPFYNEMMDKYNVFLPEEFFSNCGREKLAELVNSGDKKAIKRFVEVLGNFYEEGDPETRSIVTATILSKLAELDESRREAAYENMSELLEPSARHIVELAKKKNKK